MYLSYIYQPSSLVSFSFPLISFLYWLLGLGLFYGDLVSFIRLSELQIRVRFCFYDMCTYQWLH